MRRLVPLLFLFCLLPTVSHAATFYVRKGGSDAHACSSTDDDAHAKVTIAGGVACLTNGAGDDLVVHAGTYAESVTVSKSGLNGNQTIIQAATGETVDVTGDPAFTVQNFSYVTVQGFNFSSARGSCAATSAVLKFANTTGDKVNTPVVGIQVLNNTFTNCGSTTGGPAIRLTGLGHGDAFGSTLYDAALISGNTFTGQTGEGIANGGSSDVRVTGNSYTSGHAQNQTFDYANHFYNAGGTTVNSVFIVPLRDEVDNNTVANLLADTYVTNQSAISMDCAGVRLDSSAGYHLVKSNLIHDLCNNTGSWSFQTQGWAVYGEANVNNVTIRENIAYNISEACYRFGSSGQNQAHDNTIINNVCYNTFRFNINLAKAANITVENNSLTEGGSYGNIQLCDKSVAPNAGGTGGGHVFKNNNYYRTGNSSIGRWASACDTVPYWFAADRTLASWNSVSGEVNDLNVIPQYVNQPSDFHLLFGSPLRLAGFGTPTPDIGAYPISPPPGPGTYYVRVGGTGASCSDYQTDTPATAAATVQAAVNCAIAGAGDVVYVHTGNYAENVTLSSSNSGVLGTPWTLRAAPGEVVDISTASNTGYAIFGTNANYVHLFGFTFTHQTGGFGVIRFFNSTGDKTNTPVQGLEIDHNTCTGVGENGSQNGGQGFRFIFLHGTGRGSSYNGATVNSVHDNSSDGCYGYQVLLSGTSDTTVTNNSFQNIHSSLDTFSTTYRAFALAVETTTINGLSTVGQRNVFNSNTVSTAPRDGYVSGVMLAACVDDLGGVSNQYSSNVCHDMDNVAWTSNDKGFGIRLHGTGAGSHTVNLNQIYNNNEADIEIGETGGGEAIVTGCQVISNTLYGNKSAALVLRNASGATIQNNTGTNGGNGQVYVSTLSVLGGGLVFKNNNWWKTGTSNVGKWNWDYTTAPFPEPAATDTLSSFNTSSGEVNSLNSDPQFQGAPTNFLVINTSPLCGAAVGGVQNIGAFPNQVCASVPIVNAGANNFYCPLFITK